MSILDLPYKRSHSSDGNNADEFWELIMRSFILIGCLSTFATQSYAKVAKQEETAVFDTVVHEAEKLGREFNPRDVLVVFDIDNTTLATEDDFGSEHWFLWQAQMISQGKHTLPAITDSVDSLLSIQNWIYTVGAMHPVAAEIPARLQQMHTRGFGVVSLTSRSLTTHDITLREFAQNRMMTSSASELGLNGSLSSYLPYDLAHPETSGLSQTDVATFKLGPAKPVIFDRGILFTQGQHKGVMIKALLAKMRRHFKAIVFVDDRAVHVDGVAKAFEARPELVAAFRYTKSLQYVDRFNAGDKREVNADWCAFANGIAKSIRKGVRTKPVLNLCGRL